MLLETDKAVIAKIIKKYRKMRGLTQFELAEKVDLNEKQISRIESGQNYPTYLTFAKLLNELDIDVEIFKSNQSPNKEIENEISNIIKNSSLEDLTLFLDTLKMLEKYTKSYKNSLLKS